MFVALLCCSLPVFHSLLPTASFWSKLTRGKSSYYANFRGASRDTAGTSSAKRSGLDSGGKRQPNWINLDEQSAKGFAWPEATYHADSHALSEPTTRDAHQKPTGIQVQRSFGLA